MRPRGRRRTEAQQALQWSVCSVLQVFLPRRDSSAASTPVCSSGKLYGWAAPVVYYVNHTTGRSSAPLVSTTYARRRRDADVCRDVSTSSSASPRPPSPAASAEVIVGGGPITISLAHFVQITKKNQTKPSFASLNRDYIESA